MLLGLLSTLCQLFKGFKVLYKVSRYCYINLSERAVIEYARDLAIVDLKPLAYLSDIAI